jgi:hypothetical protein
MDFLDKYLSIKHFFIAFFIGMFMVYITVPLPEIIIRYPTPPNSGSIIYKDNADICYVYKAQEVNCPKKGVINTPLQIINNKAKNNNGAITNLFDKINGNHKETPITPSESPTYPNGKIPYGTVSAKRTSEHFARY